MRDIKHFLPALNRKQKQKYLKLYLLLHFIDMIICHSAPINYDLQRPEHNYKYNAKKPGCRSCKTNNASDLEC